jgi:peptide/nickel transport system substrate-binding protein
MATGNYWQRFEGRQHSRRRMLKGSVAGAAGAAALALAGCRQESTPATTSTESAAPQVKRGGVFVHPNLGGLLSGEWSGLDPHVLNGSYTGIMGLFYQNLIRPDPRTWDPEPEIAQKWEQPSDTTYIFTLAQGIKWHNKPPVRGRELTAQDVVYSLDRARTDDPKFQNRALLESVDKFEVVDKSTVRVTTKVPDVTVLFNLADLALRIVSPEAIEQWGTGNLTTAERGIGTGAYIIQSLDDVNVSHVRNPDYWMPGLPYLDEVKVVKFGDQEAEWAAFQAGQVHITQVPGNQSKRVLAEQRNRYGLEWLTDTNLWQTWVNTGKPPFNDARVGRALRLLVDHTEFISGWAEVWYGTGTFASHFPHILQVKGWDFTDDEYKQARTPLFLEWKQPKDDAAREALSLLSAAGFTKDKPLSFELSNANIAAAQAASQLLQSQYARLGQGVIQTELRFADNITHVAQQRQGQYDVAGPINRGSYLEPDQALTQIFHSRSALNYNKFNDPRVDQMIERQRRLFNPQERKTFVKEILTYLIQNAPNTTACTRDQLNAMQIYVKDIAPVGGRTPGHQYEKVWFDV